jgi:hypothetical protein
MNRSSLFWFLLTLLAIGIFAALGPAEKTLGANVRVVYLHGAWVWAALAGFLAAALVGAVGLVRQNKRLNLWSRALGRTGLLFWITYLPISMWAMQTNWNGLFLAEPRFRLAVVFAIAGLLIQIGVSIAEEPAWASAANIGYALALFLSLRAAQNVMHPPSPILNSNASGIQFFYFGLVLLTLLLAWQVARWWYLSNSSKVQKMDFLQVRPGETANDL